MHVKASCYMMMMFFGTETLVTQLENDTLRL